jgi:DNA-binding transcriptional ArsR family regulator
MVEQTLTLDTVFGSLADPTRRDILKRVARRELSIGEIANAYDLTFAAISKHLAVLERAKLVTKHREGKQQMVRIEPKTLKRASAELQSYQAMWEGRLDRLEAYVRKHP